LTWKPTLGATEAVHTDTEERLTGKPLPINHMPLRKRGLFNFEQLSYQVNLSGQWAAMPENAALIFPNR
jgi:hypothetical protein